MLLQASVYAASKLYQTQFLVFLCKVFPYRRVAKHTPTAPSLYFAHSFG